MRFAWTPALETAFRKIWPTLPVQTIAERFGTTRNSIYRQAEKMQLPKKATGRPRKNTDVAGAKRWNQYSNESRSKSADSVIAEGRNLLDKPLPEEWK